MHLGKPDRFLQIRYIVKNSLAYIYFRVELEEKSWCIINMIYGISSYMYQFRYQEKDFPFDIFITSHIVFSISYDGFLVIYNFPLWSPIWRISTSQIMRYLNTLENFILYVRLNIDLPLTSINIWISTQSTAI